MLGLFRAGLESRRFTYGIGVFVGFQRIRDRRESTKFSSQLRVEVVGQLGSECGMLFSERLGAAEEGW